MTTILLPKRDALAECNIALSTSGGDKQKALIKLKERALVEHNLLVALVEDSLSITIYRWLNMVAPEAPKQVEAPSNYGARGGNDERPIAPRPQLPAARPAGLAVGLPVTMIRGLSLMASEQAKNLHAFPLTKDLVLGDAGLDDLKAIITQSVRHSTKLQIQANWLRRIADRMTPTQTVKQVFSHEDLLSMAKATEAELDQAIARTAMVGAR